MTGGDELTQSGAGVTLHYWPEPRHRPFSNPWPANQPRMGCTTFDAETKYEDCSQVPQLPSMSSKWGA